MGFALVRDLGGPLGHYVAARRGRVIISLRSGLAPIVPLLHMHIAGAFGVCFTRSRELGGNPRFEIVFRIRLFLGAPSDSETSDGTDFFPKKHNAVDVTVIKANSRDNLILYHRRAEIEFVSAVNPLAAYDTTKRVVQMDIP